MGFIPVMCPIFIELKHKGTVLLCVLEAGSSNLLTPILKSFVSPRFTKLLLFALTNLQKVLYNEVTVK